MQMQTLVAHNYLSMIKIFKEIGKVDFYKMVVDSLIKTEPSNVSNFLKQN